MSEEKMQIIYNVTISVDVEKSEEWLAWMKEVHIPDVMNSGFFIESKISKVIGHEEGGKTFAVQYLCENMATYEQYQTEAAPALQEHHTKLFGTKTAAFRTILRVHQSF
ncbi:MAG: DUF4286 family protein [Crocinitomix sp.]|nr:DUF4286 family protein [Crocinitomix sp.]